NPAGAHRWPFHPGVPRQGPAARPPRQHAGAGDPERARGAARRRGVCVRVKQHDTSVSERAAARIRNRTARWHLRTVVLSEAMRYPWSVIWFFDKDGEQLRYEISRDRAAG